MPDQATSQTPEELPDAQVDHSGTDNFKRFHFEQPKYDISSNHVTKLVPNVSGRVLCPRVYIF